jgi:hypothetical protein
MPINRLYIVRAFNSKPLPLLLFFKAVDINTIIKKREDKSNINNRNKGRNILLHL